jgi:hypothetical protein
MRFVSVIVAQNRFMQEGIRMWLEQATWIWAPLVGAALIWMISRLAALGREVRSLRMRVTQLEEAAGRPVETEDHTRSVA